MPTSWGAVLHSRSPSASFNASLQLWPRPPVYLQTPHSSGLPNRVTCWAAEMETTVLWLIAKSVLTGTEPACCCWVGPAPRCPRSRSWTLTSLLTKNHTQHDLQLNTNYPSWKRGRLWEPHLFVLNLLLHRYCILFIWYSKLTKGNSVTVSLPFLSSSHNIPFPQIFYVYRVGQK